MSSSNAVSAAELRFQQTCSAAELRFQHDRFSSRAQVPADRFGSRAQVPADRFSSRAAGSSRQQDFKNSPQVQRCNSATNLAGQPVRSPADPAPSVPASASPAGSPRGCVVVAATLCCVNMCVAVRSAADVWLHGSAPARNHSSRIRGSISAASSSHVLL
jgi:hypothetical protein